MKYDRLDALNNKKMFSNRLESKTKVVAGLISPEAFLLGLQVAIFLLCPHLDFPLCTAFLLSLPLLIVHL